MEKSLQFPGNDEPGGRLPGRRLQKGMAAFDHLQAVLFQQGADGVHVVHRFVDLFPHRQGTVFIHRGFQADAAFLPNHLKLRLHRIGKDQIEGLLRGDLPLVQQVENKPAALRQISADVGKYRLYHQKRQF